MSEEDMYTASFDKLLEWFEFSIKAVARGAGDQKHTDKLKYEIQSRFETAYNDDGCSDLC